MEELSQAAEKAREMKMNEGAMRLSKELDQYYLERLKLVCSGVGVKEDMKLEVLDNRFITLFNLLKRVLGSPDKAVLFCCQVLQEMSYNAIEYFKETASPDCSYDYKTIHPKVDCMMTVLEFVSSLGERDFSDAKAYVCSHTNQASDRVKSRVELVDVLFNEELVSEDNLQFVLQLAEHSNRKTKFDNYIARRKKIGKKNLIGLLLWTGSCICMALIPA